MLPNLPENYAVGSAVDGEDCFFHCLVQGLEQLGLSNKCLTAETLRHSCKEFVKKHLKEDNSWIREIQESDSNIGKSCIENYVHHIEVITCKDIASQHAGALQMGKPIFGHPEIEGRIICDIYDVMLHIIEGHMVDQVESIDPNPVKCVGNLLGKEVHQGTSLASEFNEKDKSIQIWRSKLVDRFGSRYIDFESKNTIHLLQNDNDQFKPILRISHDIISSDSSDDEQKAEMITYSLIRCVRSKMSEEDKIKKVKELVGKGANVNFKDCNDNCNTVLHIAVCKEETMVSLCLVENGANIHIKNNENISPLEYAKVMNRHDIIDILRNQFESEMINISRVTQAQLEMRENEVRLRKGKLSELTSKPKFKKLPGDSGASGHRFEINFLTLFKLRGEHFTRDFFLAGNMDGAGAFDDVVFKYWNEKGETRTIFLQAKHRMDTSLRKINFETFQRDKDFSLRKYFTSYLEIKEHFQKGHRNPIFDGQYEDSNCDFVIFTNASLDGVRDRGAVIVDAETDDPFKIGTRGNCIKLQMNAGVEYLRDVERKEYINMLVKKFMEFIVMDKNENLMRDDVVKKYHVFWAQNVLEINHALVIEQGKSNKKVRKYRNATFRKEFLHGPADNFLFEQFRKEVVLNEIMKRKLESRVIKVPEEFGNVSQQLNFNHSVQELCRLLIDLIGQYVTMNTCKIYAVKNKKLLADISKLVGNVFVLNDSSRLLKLNDEQLTGDAQYVLETLQGKMIDRNINSCIDFCFEIENFPTLLFSYSSKNESNFQDFVSKLRIVTDQPSVAELDETIKQEMKMLYKLNDDEVHQTFLRISNKMTRSWLETGQVNFFRKADAFFSDIVRNGIHFRVKQPVHSFTGRAKELELLHKSLETNKMAVISQMVTISGLGGIGKSELARKYASDYGQFYDNNLIWIDAENLATVQYSFRTLCQNELNIAVGNERGRPRPINDIVKDVYRFFSQRKSLFVFDNAVGSTSNTFELEQFLPRSCSENKCEPVIIVTSRNSNWKTGQVLQLGTFSDEEAEEFVKSFLKIKDDTQDGDVKSLISMLQNFPLALQQAVAFIREKDADNRDLYLNGEFKISDYLKLYQDKNRELLNFKFPEDSLDYYTTTTFKTWNITMENVKQLKFGRVATKIMNIMAYLSPDDTPVELFSKMAAVTQVIINNAIRLLEQYSLITLSEGLASIHRLVQNVVRMKLQDGRKEKRILREALFLIGNTAEHKHKVHGVSVWNYAMQEKDLVKEFSLIPSEIMSSLNRSVRYEEAYLLGETSLELLNSLLGPDHLSTISVRHYFANSLSNRGMYDAALRCCREVLEKSIQILESDHKDTLTTHYLMAQILYNQGKYKEALTCYKEVFEKRLRTLGSEHKDTLTAENNVAETLSTLGKFEEALSFYKEVLEKRIKILGSDHLSTLTTQYTIAQTLVSQGKHEEALSSCKEVLRRRTIILGSDHRDTLSTQHTIAQILSAQGKYEEALCSYKEVFEKKQRIFKSDHPDVLATQNNIALTLSAQGKFGEALDTYKETFEKYSKLLGPDHPSTLATQNNIAITLSNQGNYSEALKSYMEVLEKITKILGPEHPNTLMCQNNIAVTRYAQGKYTEALDCFQNILEKRMKLLGADHPDTLVTQHYIVQTLYHQGNYSEALSINEVVLQKRIGKLGLDHPHTLTTRHTAAEIMSSQGNHEEALHLFNEIFMKRTNILGSDHPHTLRTRSNVGNALSNQGKYEDALRVLEEVLEKSIRKLGADHPDVLQVKFTMAKTWFNQGKYEEALSSYKELFEKSTKILGSEHPHTLSIRNAIAEAEGKYEETLNSSE